MTARVCLRLKVRMLKAEVIETLLYGRVTWSPNEHKYDRLRGSFTITCFSDASADENGGKMTTPSRNPACLPRQTPSALRRYGE